jgi:hypothetical protein
MRHEKTLLVILLLQYFYEFSVDFQFLAKDIAEVADAGDALFRLRLRLRLPH